MFDCYTAHHIVPTITRRRDVRAVLISSHSEFAAKAVVYIPVLHIDAICWQRKSIEAAWLAVAFNTTAPIPQLSAYVAYSFAGIGGIRGNISVQTNDTHGTSSSSSV